FPYICLKGVERNDDGTFTKSSKIPLVVWNGSGMKSVEWKLNGKAVKTDADGYFTPAAGGKLMAVVTWDDGSQDVLVKEVEY
ncbi:MAG: hypothetical protein ACI4TM_03635, partial [Candidatus Cryptobacteroides sp.]